MSVGGQGPGIPGFLKFWRHVFTPNSRQSAGIALKTSPIESYQFSASKLCPDFFFNSDKKYFFSGSKIFFDFFFGQKYFSAKIPQIEKICPKKIEIFKILSKSQNFENFDNFKLKEREAPGLSENVSTGFG